VGDVAAIDKALKLGANHPMGPLELADFMGLDVVLAIMNVLYEGQSDSKYRPCPLLVKYVEAGWVGRKSGRGFYRHPEGAPAASAAEVAPLAPARAVTVHGSGPIADALAAAAAPVCAAQGLVPGRVGRLGEHRVELVLHDGQFIR
jgi:3-hydroxyacyl-CoA dehydrogenase